MEGVCENQEIGDDEACTVTVGSNRASAEISLWNFTDHYVLDRLERLQHINPDKLMYAWLDRSTDIVESFTRAEFWTASRDLAVVLSTKHGVVAGDRVMVVYPPGLDFIVGFFACLHLGAVIVSVYPPNPTKLKVDLPKFDHFVQDSGSVVALTTTNYKSTVQMSGIRHKWNKTLKWVATNNYQGNSRLAAKVHNTEGFSKWAQPVDPDALALIQYTSGSTGSPKGVMITNRNIAAQMFFCHNIADIDSFDPNLENTAIVSWVPQYHDLGLFLSYLSHASLGSTAYLMSPMTFLQDPVVFPRAIARYRPSVISGPNFAYGLVAKRLQAAKMVGEYDLSSVHCVICGGEPTEPKERDSACNIMGLRKEAFFNYYGLAEHTLGISVLGRVEREGRISAGNVNYSKRYGIEIRVVDCNSYIADNSTMENQKMLQEVSPGMEGEVVVQSDLVAAGYWNVDNHTNNETFKAPIRQLNGSVGKYLRTGDVGRVDFDGELFITSRLKDLIIINGRNFAPNDIERAAEDVDCTVIRPGSSVAFQDSNLHSILIVELRKDKEVSVATTRLTSRIRAAVSSACGLDVHQIVLVKARTIPKTTSGKVQRRETARRWTDGALNKYVVKTSVKPDSNAHFSENETAVPQLWSSEAETWLSGRVAELLHLSVDDVKPTADLISLGFTSMTTVALSTHLETLAGVPIPASFIAEHATVRQILSGLRDLDSTGEHIVYPEVSLPDVRLVPSTRIASTLFTLAQFIGALLVWTSLVVAVLPSYYFGRFVQYDLSLSPWSYIPIGQTRMFGLLLPLVIPLWMVSFTALVVVCKWVVVWKYQDRVRVPMQSVAFLRWWWLDRLLHTWEQYVGYFIRTTLLLNTVYWLMGAKVSFTSPLEVFYREFDLIHIGDNCTVEGALVARMFDPDSRTLLFRRIVIGDRCYLSAGCTVQPGCDVADQVYLESLTVLLEGSHTRKGMAYTGNPAREAPDLVWISDSDSIDPWSTIGARFLFRMAGMVLTLYLFFLVSTPVVVFWDRVLPSGRYINFLFWTLGPFINGLMVIPVVVLIKWVLIGRAVEGKALVKPLAWLVDFQFRVNYFTAWRLLDDYSVLTMLWLRSYGAHMSWRSLFVPLSIYKPSTADHFHLADHSFVSTAYIHMTTARDNLCAAVRVGRMASVGLGAVLGAGTQVEERASVGPMTFVAPFATLAKGMHQFGSTLKPFKVDNAPSQPHLPLMGGFDNKDKPFHKYGQVRAITNTVDTKSTYTLHPDSSEKIVSGSDLDKSPETVDVGKWIAHLCDCLRGNVSAPATLQSMLTSIFPTDHHEISTHPRVKPLLLSAQSFDPLIERVQSLMLHKTGPFAVVVATLSRDLFERGDEVFPGVSFTRDVLPVVLELLHWITLYDAVTMCLCEDNPHLWTDLVLPDFSRRFSNRADDWFIKAKGDIMLAIAHALSNDTLTQAEAGVAVKSAFRYNVLMAVAAEVANTQHAKSLSDNTVTGHLISEVFGLHSSVQPDTFCPDGSIWLYDGLSEHFLDVYRLWNAIFIAGSYTRTGSIAAFVAPLLLPEAILSASPKQFVQHRTVSLLLAVMCSESTTGDTVKVLSSAQTTALITAGAIARVWAEDMPELQGLTRSTEACRRAREAYTVQTVVPTLSQHSQPWDSVSGAKALLDFYRHQPHDPNPAPVSPQSPIAIDTPQTNLSSRTLIADSAPLSAVVSFAVRVALLVSYIICLVPAYEWANYLLFVSDIPRGLAILALGSCMPLVFIVVCVWCSLLTRALLGRRPTSDRFNCSLPVYVLTQSIADTNEMLLMPALHGTAFMPVYCWCMGATVGRNVYINTPLVKEHFLVTIGDGAIIDSAYVTAHQFVGNTLEAGGVRVAPECLMQPGSAVLPGAAAVGVVVSRSIATQDEEHHRKKKKNGSIV